jgi:FG-GAP-like repeat
MSARRSSPVVFGGLTVLAIATLIFVAACSGREEPPPPAPKAVAAPPAPKLAFVAQPIGDPVNGHPWIAHAAVVDLDGDGLPDVLVCDAQANQLRWIRQYPRGVYTEYPIGDVMAPAHVDACDVYKHGRLDLLVASMGQIFPNNDRIGSVIIFENLGNGQFRRHVVGEHMARVTDVRGADLFGNGTTQLVVGCFGYDQGETLWMENKGDWKFEPHVVNTQSGPIHTPVADYFGDGRLEFASLISQEWEEVHLFDSLGNGKFKDTIIWGSTNEDYGSSGLVVADINRDGRPDFVYTNGDAFDYARPGPRPWHGIQWIENKGGGHWAFHRVGDLPGAYGPSAADLNGDGFIDLLAVSTFNDWSSPNAVSMMAWINDGREHFTPVPLAHSPTHLLTTAIADMDGDGVPEIITGGFHFYPPYDRMSRVLLWKRK